MGLAFIVYIVLSLIAAIVLSRKADKKLIAFIFVFWILGQPILTDKCTIDLPGFAFNLSPNRILLFIVTFLLYLGWFVKGDRRTSCPKPFPKFEFFLYTYCVLVCISLVIHHHRIPLKDIIVIPAEILLFIVVYHFLKREITPSVREAIIRAVVLVSIVVAAIAVYQILVDSSFMVICSPRMAFGRFIRSTSIFPGEYEVGYLLVFSSIVVLVRYRQGIISYSILLLLFIGLITTFHRLVWIIYVVCMLIYLCFCSTRAVAAGAICFFILVCLIALSYFILPDTFDDAFEKKGVREFTEGRLLEDTLTGRLNQYRVGIKAIPKHPFGVGGYNSTDYHNLMGRNYHITRRGKAGVIHNGYIATSIYYGFVAMCCLLGMHVLMLSHFWKKIDYSNLETVYPFFIVLIVVLANACNDWSSFKPYFVILTGIITGSFVSLKHSKSNDRKN